MWLALILSILRQAYLTDSKGMRFWYFPFSSAQGRLTRTVTLAAINILHAYASSTNSAEQWDPGCALLR